MVAEEPALYDFLPNELGVGEYGSRLSGYNLLGSLTCDFVSVCEASRGVVRLWYQGDDSVAYVDDIGRKGEFNDKEETSTSPDLNDSGEEAGDGKVKEGPTLDDLRELLQKATEELELAQRNSSMFEEKAQRISEAAIAVKDDEENAWDNVYSICHTIQEILNEETVAKEAVQKATTTLSLAEANLHMAMELLETAKRRNSLELRVRLQSRKEELQKEVDRLNDVAEKAQVDDLKVDEDVANVMLLAEQVVAFELEAADRASDAEIPLSRAEKILFVPHFDDEEELVEDRKVSQGNTGDIVDENDSHTY
ncbi:hypothetical protein Vadar_019352 [Vaccinium darrowii]|uniref:Uncharacterized protein n=1 Tax=Vaccinium darrowii TaxID=229202 RepID=A0ACB7X256_9ERIC|nr:hypothetical protein Vadar_019352 [Vaccinium darrowii]